MTVTTKRSFCTRAVKANTTGDGHAVPDQNDLHEVAAAIADAGGLIAGWGEAKTEPLTHPFA